jgi:aspartate ammonia-lyase
MEPVMAFALFNSIMILENAMKTLRDKCITGITANPEHTRDMVLGSLGIVTLLSPILGYKRCSEIALEGSSHGKSIHQIAVLEQKLLSQEKWDELFSIENLLNPKLIQRSPQ